MFKKMKVFSLGLGLLGVACMTPELAKAAGPCVNCHTMHNSQDGLDLNVSPNDALIKSANGCIGCHTGTNNGGINVTPYVLDIGAVLATKSLAGGTFYWVATQGGADDIKGHNVAGISGQDTIITVNPLTPPGWNPAFVANTQVNNGVGTWSAQLTCAGTNGCHGQHEIAGAPVGEFAAVSGAHHADDSVIDGSTTGKSFRFLYGILGKEAADWEYPNTLTTSNHNQYYGYVRTSDAQPTVGNAIKSINYLCAECHGNFHSGADILGASPSARDGSAVHPWIRHPTDFDMNGLAVGTEYKNYGGALVNAYVPLTPVASNDVSVVKSVVLQAAGDAIVSCISCHRAHGSEYDDLLRWDYGTCLAGTDNVDCGCFQCHTTKDAG